MSTRKKSPPAAPTPAENNDSIPRTGSGAGSALQAMLKKRQMGAHDEPQPAEAAADKGTAE